MLGEVYKKWHREKLRILYSKRGAIAIFICAYTERLRSFKPLGENRCIKNCTRGWKMVENGFSPLSGHILALTDWPVVVNLRLADPRKTRTFNMDPPCIIYTYRRYYACFLIFARIKRFYITIFSVK